MRCTKFVLKAIRSFAECPPQKIKIFSRSVDKFGFGEKYIRGFEKSKERAKCLLMSKYVKIIDNN